MQEKKKLLEELLIDTKGLLDLLVDDLMKFFRLRRNGEIILSNRFQYMTLDDAILLLLLARKCAYILKASEKEGMDIDELYTYLRRYNVPKEEIKWKLNVMVITQRVIEKGIQYILDVEKAYYDIVQMLKRYGDEKHDC